MALGQQGEVDSSLTRTQVRKTCGVVKPGLLRNRPWQWPSEGAVCTGGQGHELRSLLVSLFKMLFIYEGAALKALHETEM